MNLKKRTPYSEGYAAGEANMSLTSLRKFSQKAGFGEHSWNAIYIGWLDAMTKDMN